MTTQLRGDEGLPDDGEDNFIQEWQSGEGAQAATESEVASSVLDSARAEVKQARQHDNLTFLEPRWLSSRPSISQSSSSGDRSQA